MSQFAIQFNRRHAQADRRGRQETLTMLEHFAKGRTELKRLLAALPVLVGAISMLGACASFAPADDRAMTEAHRQVIANPIRTDQDRRTDAARHPAEFLAFTQVRPGMQALDVSAGFGYTSQLLALAVGPSGDVWAQAQQPGAGLIKRLADHPQANLVIVARPFEDPVPEQAPKLDLITLVLNYHDISYLPVDRARMNQRLFSALKPGGRYIIIDHAGRSGTGISEGKTLHRIDEAVVLAEVRQAGFVLDAESDFLRNPADPRDQTSTGSPIPTDKFALRFVKPR
jgi:predicted methyltransferase